VQFNFQSSFILIPLSLTYMIFLKTMAFPIQDWVHPWNPFDAIGFPTIKRQAPTRQEFAQAVRYARFATQPERLQLASAAATAPAPKLPYSWEQIKQSIDYLTGSSHDEDSSGQTDIDKDIWEWAFFDIIELQHLNQYIRTWAPEQKRWELMVLDPPVVIDTTLSPPPSTQPPKSVLPTATATATKTIIDVEKVDAHKPSLPLSDIRLTTPSSTLHNKVHATVPSPFIQAPRTPLPVKGTQPPATATADDNNIDVDMADAQIPTLPLSDTESHIPSTTTNDKVSGNIHRSTGSGATRSQRLAHGTYLPGQSVFLGWHVQQLKLAGANATAEKDYRQAVFGAIAPTGHIHFRLRTHNMRGQTVPQEYRLKGISSVPHHNIVYHQGFNGLSYESIRLEIARQSLIPTAQRIITLWVKTPESGDEEGNGIGNGNEQIIEVQPRRRGRPKGSKNKKKM
jgi:hypothetical protein